MYILGEAVRRRYEIHPSFLDSRQKGEHIMRNGSALTPRLNVDSAIACESHAGRFHRVVHRGCRRRLSIAGTHLLGKGTGCPPFFARGRGARNQEFSKL